MASNTSEPIQEFITLVQSKWTQYFYMLTVTIISFIFMVRFWLLSKKGQSKLSTQLQIHVCVYIAFNFFVMLYVGPIVFLWFAKGRFLEDGLGF